MIEFNPSDSKRFDLTNSATRHNVEVIATYIVTLVYKDFFAYRRYDSTILLSLQI